MPRPIPGLVLSSLCLAAAAIAAQPAVAPRGHAGGGDPVGAKADVGRSMPAAAPSSQVAPSPLRPADGESLHGVGMRFAWQRSAGLRYRLQVARDAAFTDLVVDRDGFDAGEAIVALSPGDYHWRVAALQPAEGATPDTGPYSDVRRFVLRPVPASPAPEPPRLQAGALTLRWQAGQPGEGFEAELARDPMFADIVARHAGPEAQLVLPDPAAGTFYLRVRTVDVTGYAGPYGPAQAIDVPRSLWWQLLPPLSMLWWLLLL